MSGVPNTLRRAGIYHFRRGVPTSLRRLIGRSELLRSLMTCDQVLARRRSRRLYLETEAIFGLARSMPMLEDHRVRDLVQRFYRFELDDENRMRLDGVAFDEASRQAAIAYHEDFGRNVRLALGRNDLSVASVWVDELLRREGIATDLDPESRSKLAQGVLRAGVEVSNALRKRFEGDFGHTPTDEALAEQPLAVTARASIPPVLSAASAADGPPFSTRAEEFRQTRERRAIWDRQTALQARKTYQLFVEATGDRPLSAYQRADAVRFKNLLLDLPARYGKAAAYRGMAPQEIVEASRNSGEVRLSGRTVQRHLSALSALWKEEIEEGRASENIFGNFQLPAAKRAKDQRAMWPASRLSALFNSPVWRGCKSRARLTTPGEFVFRDEHFWLPLIALFSGMRQEEIAQLDLDDVREEEGIWVFDIHGRGDHMIKNTTAARLVPVHSQLIRMGLLDHARQTRKDGHSRLFPTMQRGGADGRFGHNFSKWFGRYCKSLNLSEGGLVFHSLRHSATTFMAQAGVASEVIDRVTGHVTAGETARYTKDFRISQLKEAIEGIDPGIDLAFLHVREAS